ncbi:MAG: allose kinase [Christensenellaceae bacterium]|nr:allose kinase [Christensenellaceae bacterium]
MTRYMIGIDIGGTNFRIGAVNQEYEVLKHKIVSSRTFLEMERPVNGLLEAIISFIKEIEGKPCGICMGFPGTVTKDKSTVLSCPNLPVFDGVNISKVINQALDIPVIIEHEVLLLLTNDMYHFSLFDKNCVIAIYLGTGLGNAIYIHGRMIEGANGVSGELGHIPIPGNKTPCPCGNIGCIEPRASGKRLEEICIEKGLPEKAFTKALADGASDPLISDFLDHVACAIATEINILDPNCVIMGGGVMMISNFPYDALLERIYFHTRKPFPAENLKFIRLEPDPLQGVRGAGIYAWRYMNKKKSSLPYD